MKPRAYIRVYSNGFGVTEENPDNPYDDNDF